MVVVSSISTNLFRCAGGFIKKGNGISVSNLQHRPARPFRTRKTNHAQKPMKSTINPAARLRFAAAIGKLNFALRRYQQRRKNTHHASEERIERLVVCWSALSEPGMLGSGTSPANVAIAIHVWYEVITVWGCSGNTLSIPCFGKVDLISNCPLGPRRPGVCVA